VGKKKTKGHTVVDGIRGRRGERKRGLSTTTPLYTLGREEGEGDFTLETIVWERRSNYEKVVTVRLL